MSQHHIQKIVCPKCAAQGEMTIWDSINVQLNPELKDKVMDESLFTWTCPSCGHQVYITFGTLYHDLAGQFMLFFDHKAEDNDLSEDAFPDNEAFAQFNKNYRLRYVHGIHALKEKIFIFDEGLSDVMVELLKYFVRNQVIRINESDIIALCRVDSSQPCRKNSSILGVQIPRAEAVNNIAVVHR